MKRKILLVLFMAIAGVCNTIAQENWVTFTKASPEEPTVTLQQSNTTAVVFNVETPGMYVTEVTNGGGEYQRIRLPKQIRTTNEGHPEIPVIRQLIAIPECDEVNNTFQTNSPVYFEDYTVYPSPAYQEVQNPDGTVYMEEVFTIDQTIYNTNSFIPQLTADIIEVGSIRSQL